nr:hypothetical protein [Clostridium gasigenes]
MEEFLEGEEASILSITDRKTIVPFLSVARCSFHSHQTPQRFLSRS